MKSRRYLFHHPQQHFPTSSFRAPNQKKQAQTGLTHETRCCLRVSLSSIHACSNACNLFFVWGTGKTIACEAEQGIEWWGSPVLQHCLFQARSFALDFKILRTDIFRLCSVWTLLDLLAVLFFFVLLHLDVAVSSLSDCVCKLSWFYFFTSLHAMAMVLQRL